jgi:hypothetical protein
LLWLPWKGISLVVAEKTKCEHQNSNISNFVCCFSVSLSLAAAAAVASNLFILSRFFVANNNKKTSKNQTANVVQR